MAGDWIKMRTDLYRDPKVCLIADALLDTDGELARYVNQNCQRDIAVTRNVTRNATVGALVTVWGVLRHRGKRVGVDLVVTRCSLSVVDDIADMPGFGEAMASVGWVSECDEGLIFPNFFEELNVDPADETRAKNAERQRQYRERKAKESNVTVTSPRYKNVTLEKSRERVEKSNKSLSPSRNEKDEFHSHLFTDPVLDRDDFRTAWERWVNYYNSQNDKPLNEIQALSMLEDFSRSGADKAIADITFTIRKNCHRRILDSSNDWDKKQSSTAGASKGRKLKSAKELLGGSDA